MGKVLRLRESTTLWHLIDTLKALHSPPSFQAIREWLSTVVVDDEGYRTYEDYQARRYHRELLRGHF